MGFKALHLLILLSLNVLALQMAMAQARKVPTLDWVLKETNYTRLCSTKKILTINGMFPGPTLHLYKGDRIKVNVHNQADYGVTLHWHGVKQPRNSWSDGPDNIAQCAIKPQANYTYEIILSDEEGTIWWHAHSDWSRATVYGAIIVKPKPPNKYPFKKPDGEVSLILGSWYKADVMQVITEALASGGETNKSDAFTINGQPGDTEPCSSEGMFRMKVDHGKTYLLRLINGVLNENMFFMVANHKLTVVGMDGAYIKPIVTNYIMITPGQTMDILMKANQRRSYYYIASRAFGELVYSNATTTALIQYTGNYKPPVNASFPDLPDYNASMRSVAFTRRLRSLATKKYPIDVPKTIQKRLIMTIGLNTLPCGKGNETCSGPNGDRLSSTLNNITFADPKIDVLQAYYKKIKSVFKPDFPSKPENPYNYIEDPMLNTNTTMSDKNGTRIKFLEYNTTIEIVFQGTNALNGSETHPMHVHGYSFYVVGSAPAQIFDEVRSPKGYNLVDPPLVNTIGVPKNGWTAIRFRADNPGVWYMHCHLERHTSWGMSTVLIVKNGPTRATSLRAPHYINPC